MRNKNGQFIKGHSEGVRFGAGQKGHNQPHSNKTKEKLRLQRTGKPTWASLHRDEMREISKKLNTKQFLPSNKGKKHTEEWKKKISQSHIGIKPSIETRKKMSLIRLGKKLTPETCKKMSESRRGEKSHFWKGGITPINAKIRNSFEMKLWREAILIRDNFSCVWCGKLGGKLQVDHIKPFSLYPELRFSIDNGRVLCIDCHKTTETYLSKLYNYKKLL